MIHVRAEVERSSRIVMEKTLNLKIEKFLSKIHDIYPDKYFEIEKYFYNNKPVTFRVNKLKLGNNSIEQIINNLRNKGFELNDGPIKNSFICNYRKAELKLSETEELNNECFITAVENNKKRYYILKNNMETLGAKCVNALYDNSVTLLLKYPNLSESFDRVLLDVPCSNEGSIYLHNSKSLEKWNSKTAERLAKLQRTLLYSGISLLKPGGSLLYSTCTYSIEENEQVIDWALKK